MKNNEAAFPSSPYLGRYDPEWGLTKRELIAAMAMQGLLATPGEYEHAKTIAQWAVDQADALIERLAADPAEGASDE
jgi:hypothetical protein